jgi:hypothetical protein
MVVELGDGTLGRD